MLYFSRENKDLKQQQARTSVEIVKEIRKDPSLKSNAERDRRLREKHSQNTKIFIDERKGCAMKQEKRREKLKKQHEAQLNDLVKYVQNVSFYSNLPNKRTGTINEFWEKKTLIDVWRLFLASEN